MKDLILENEKLIEKFDFNYYLGSRLYAIAAALGALETTNKISKSFINKRNCDYTQEDHILRLYALLQGLFVSIDSLYALTLSLTKNKDNININNNKDIRQIKYIRNDVVGHPSSRLLSTTNLAYCILDDKSIDAYSFKYNIYSTNSVIEKNIVIDDLLNAYYSESNKLLDELYTLSTSKEVKNRLKSNVELMIESYVMGGRYQDSLEKVITNYKNKYPQANSETHRVLWRYELVKKLETYNVNDKDEKELINYCIGLELVKIYELITNIKYDFKKKLPKFVSSIYRFFKQNKNAYFNIKHLTDSDNPIFSLAIDSLITEANKSNSIVVIRYLTLIKNELNNKNYDLVYALNLPIKEYTKK